MKHDYIVDTGKPDGAEAWKRTVMKLSSKPKKVNMTFSLPKDIRDRLVAESMNIGSSRAVIVEAALRKMFDMEVD